MTPCRPGDARLLQELLGRLDPGGILSCACGREHRIAAGDVLVAGDATFGAAELLRRRYGPSATVWVLSDENTGDRGRSAVEVGVRRDARSARGCCRAALAAGPQPWSWPMPWLRR